MKAIAHILTYATYPMVITATIASVFWVNDLGYKLWIAVSFSTAVGMVLIYSAEHLNTYRGSWSRNRGDLRTDLAHIVVNGFVPELFRVACHGSLFVIAADLSTQSAYWPVESHWILQLLLALVVAEFFTYWLHRIMHEKKWAWPWHAAHHSAQRLYFLNAARFHPVDVLATVALSAVPLILLGCPLIILALHAAFTATHGLLQHANVNVKLGLLNWFFSTPILHRWHHSLDIDEANSNYGANLILWDIVFRTRKIPAGKMDVGVLGINVPNTFTNSYIAHLLAPFRWKKYIRR